jgi:hypothetical protein
MTILVTRVTHDGLGLPDVTIRTSSEEGLQPTRMSLSKEDTESTRQMPGLDQAASPQFPEGGLQAWLTVVGGYVPSLQADPSD